MDCRGGYGLWLTRVAELDLYARGCGGGGVGEEYPGRGRVWKYGVDGLI